MGVMAGLMMGLIDTFKNEKPPLPIVRIKISHKFNHKSKSKQKIEIYNGRTGEKFPIIVFDEWSI